jgi:hypothetical protein
MVWFIKSLRTAASRRDELLYLLRCSSKRTSGVYYWDIQPAVCWCT